MRLLWQAAILCLAVNSGRASTLYSNGSINGTAGAYTITGSINVSDSFVIASDSTILDVSNIGLWVSTETNAPLTLDWTISTAPAGGGTVEGSGTDVSLSTSFFGDTTPDDGVYSASFSVPSLNLAAGTYYLELYDATAQNSKTVFWDENSGPSVAYQDGLGPLPSNSFEIDGIVDTPEPNTAPLCLALLLALVATALLRKRRPI